MIGDGFKQAVPHKIGDADYDVVRSNYVGKLPNLSIGRFAPLAFPFDEVEPWNTSVVHRRGFEEGFHGPRILVPRGVQIPKGRIRASYTEKSFTFFSIIQAITIPEGQEHRGKLLAALLNSRVFFWFAFHGTASLGSDRPEIQKSELLRLPFPSASDMPEPKRAEAAGRKLVSIIDEMRDKTANPFALESEDNSIYSKIDRLSYEYFCCSDDEIILIEDAVEKIFPAVQPSQGSFPEIWKSSTTDERREYAQVLARSLSEWLDEGCSVQTRFEAHNADLGVLRLTLEIDNETSPYTEAGGGDLGAVLSQLTQHIHRSLGGNFQLMPDFRVFVGSHLYLVKPMQKRFWLRSAALADADAVSMDLQDATTLDERRS